GLANRMLFLDRLDHEIASAKRQRQTFALLYLDLDQFKRINDNFGHHIGDLLLKSVAETLQGCIRASDTASRSLSEDSDSLIARLGGDEFIILLSNIKNPKNAALVARRILQDLPQSFDLEGHEVSVTTSIGICICPTDGTEAEVLLKRADEAMYHAKQTGRNRYQYYKESLNQSALEHFSIEQALKNGLEQNEFVLFYQPQIDLVSRKIVGAEALIRWLHPQKGVIQPSKFIPIAEESGLIVDINKWVIRTACEQNTKWQESGFDPVRIAVNLSGYKIAGQNIIDVIREVLLDTDLDAANLELEITENILMQDTKDTILLLKQMKDLNLRIAMDDFGTGYSSLSYLASFPVDIIKIDRSFVMGCTMQKTNLIIIKAIIAMGESLGMKIIAEGIESEEQYNIMKDQGAHEGQGFYFSPPVPQEEFEKLLAKGVL
ncbi:MAG: putative bifunctional diguanylate cyclase/phosphodiesterase, partial [Desulforhopalus sp.]